MFKALFRKRKTVILTEKKLFYASPDGKCLLFYFEKAKLYFDRKETFLYNVKLKMSKVLFQESKIIICFRKILFKYYLHHVKKKMTKVLFRERKSII